MLLTLSTTHRPASDLGHLLHKHPDRVQRFEQSFGTATVCYPEATDERCTVALLLEVDPERLARSRRHGTPDFALAQHVNDRSYAASSLLAVAMADVFSTARAGRCASRQELAGSAIPLEIDIPVLPCRGGPEVARRVFAPLGWQVAAEPIALDVEHPEWGESRYVRLYLAGTVRLADALRQLHVLLPVLDESKHYWQGPDEVDKLLRSGGEWLAAHPERELITRRYLGRAGGLTNDALARLEERDEGSSHGTSAEGGSSHGTSAGVGAERRVPLRVRRAEVVHEVLREVGARSVIDLGCGGGQLLARLVRDPAFATLAGTDVSARSLRQAHRRLHLDDATERQAERVRLFQSALTYEDERLVGYDAAVLMEVVEHVDASRLPALEHVVLGVAAPRHVLLTTPNREYNALYPDLVGMRHPDHRFEWDRAELAAWSDAAAARHGYTVERRGIGVADPERGAPTQLAIFTKGESADD